MSVVIQPAGSSASREHYLDTFTVSKDIPTYCQGRIDSRPPSATP